MPPVCIFLLGIQSLHPGGCGKGPLRGLLCSEEEGPPSQIPPVKACAEPPPVQQLLPPALALVSSESVSGDHSMSLGLAVGCGRKGQLHLTPICRPNQPLPLGEGRLSTGGLLWPWAPTWLAIFEVSVPGMGGGRGCSGGKISLLLSQIWFALWGRSLVFCGSGAALEMRDASPANPAVSFCYPVYT